ncbi:MAG TPA: DNA replication and repair protein RecF, partial [Alcanivorax sp.]|nr:DNA replication and repair protein RecF [Alcanivorax sp.]
MLSRLQLGDFRNYRQLDIALSPSLNVILGDNGSGKTSLLEAIYFIGSGGRSFRGGRLSRLVRDGAPAATLYAEVSAGENIHRLGVRRTPGGIDAIKLNGETPRALSEVAGLLPVLALHPTSVELVFGASALRRRFMDWGMFHVEHEFMPVWRTASAALKQRNALLRTG